MREKPDEHDRLKHRIDHAVNELARTGSGLVIAMADDVLARSEMLARMLKPEVQESLAQQTIAKLEGLLLRARLERSRERVM